MLDVLFAEQGEGKENDRGSQESWNIYIPRQLDVYRKVHRWFSPTSRSDPASSHAKGEQAYARRNQSSTQPVDPPILVFLPFTARDHQDSNDDGHESESGVDVGQKSPSSFTSLCHGSS